LQETCNVRLKLLDRFSAVVVYAGTLYVENLFEFLTGVQSVRSAHGLKD